MIKNFSWLKLERYLFYLLIFTAPLQIRKILTAWTHPAARGFNEWTAAFLYGTDLLIVLLLCLWLFRARKSLLKLSWRSFSVTDWFLAVFLILAALSLGVAGNFPLGLYRWVKLLEFSAFFWYLACSTGTVLSFPRTLVMVMYAGLLQAGLAIGQAFKQSSLGWSWLGEPILRTNFHGVAVVPVEGEKFLRAYGTTPHPNVLAAWLFLAVFAFYFWYLYPKAERKWWQGVAIYLPLLWGFWFTFSRVAIGLWLGGVLVRFGLVLAARGHYRLSKVFIRRVWTLVLISVLAGAVFTYGYWPVWQSRLQLRGDDLALTERISYNKMATAVTMASPWWGVGWGQFVWEMFDRFPDNLAYFYQPAHNIYLLISSETGLIAAAVWGLFIFYLIFNYVRTTKIKHLWQMSFLVVLVSVLLMGVFDHFLWTIQQGQILLWLILALGHYGGRFLSPSKNNILKR